MKILERDEARKLIGRLGQMKRFPIHEQGAISELVDALMVGPKEQIDEEIAKKVISSFVQDATSETECPMPRDIRTAVCSHLEEKRYDPDCPRCHGDGAFPVKRMYRGEEIEEWASCNCLARRAAPVWEKAPDNPPADIIQAIKAREGAK